MANKRMFSMKIVDTDAFLDMPLSTQCLYFHLNMRADDDGFIGNPKRVCKLVGCKEDDLKLLIAKKFVLVFDSGVIVIKHWRLHNTLSTNRYAETIYTDEKKQLLLKENKVYSFDSGEPLDDSKKIIASERQARRTIDAKKTDADIDIDKDIDKEKDKEIEKKAKHKYGEYKNVLLTDDEYQKLFNEYPNADELIQYLDEYIEMKGYKAKSHYLAIRKWVVDAVKRKNYNKTDTSNPFLSMLMKEGTE